MKKKKRPTKKIKLNRYHLEDGLLVLLVALFVAGVYLAAHRHIENQRALDDLTASVKNVQAD